MATARRRFRKAQRGTIFMPDDSTDFRGTITLADLGFSAGLAAEVM